MHNERLEESIEEKEAELLEVIQKFKQEAAQFKKERKMLKNRVAKLKAEASAENQEAMPASVSK